MSSILLALVLAGPGRAATPVPTGSERKALAEKRAAEDSAKQAAASAAATANSSCAADIAETVAKLRAGADKEAYDCVIATDGADAVVIAVLETMPAVTAEEPAADGERNRLTRALALYAIARIDDGISDEMVRALLPADRRLVRDAVHARRGRKSPSSEHEGVFEKLGWYSPDPKFTNARLTPGDKAVIDKLDHPPAPPEPVLPETAAEAIAAAQAGEGESSGRLCGCAAAPGLPALPLLLPLLVVARRRR